MITWIYTLGRRWRVDDGYGAFVLAGKEWTNRGSTPTDILVLGHNGFDGQFFYRFAHAPWRVEMHRVFGVQLDYAARSGRIGYPLLAWLASFGGRPGLVPGALVAVNVLAMGALAMIGAALAKDRGRSEWWGLVLAFYWGFAAVVGRDLSEVVAAVAVFGMLLAVARHRYGWASVAATWAVMTREQAVLSVAAVAVGVFWHAWRMEGGRCAARRAATIAVPAATVFLAWQVWVASITGDLPATASSTANSTFPFGALIGSLRNWAVDAVDVVHGRLGVNAIVPLSTFLAIVVMVAIAVVSGALPVVWRERPWELLLGGVALLVLVSSTNAVFVIPVEFRQSSEVVGVSWLVLWQAQGRGARWRWVAAAWFVPFTLGIFLWRTGVR